MSTTLDPDGRPVFVGADVVLETPGLTGEAEILDTAGPGMRAAENTTPALEAAIRSTGLFEQLTLVIDGADEVPQPAGTLLRSNARGEAALIAEVPGPGDGFHQMLLHVDEEGVATWCFPEPVDAAAAEIVHRSGDRRRYVVPKHVPRRPSTGTRGLFGYLGRKILKVVAFKALELVGGVVGEFFVSRWEQAKRGYALRSFTPDDYATEGGTPLGGADWRALAGGRALLFVHGTFSRAHSAFGQLPRDDVVELHQRYGGRVFAFDHPTASHTPDENVRHLLAAVPAGMQLDVDIVCHSRGGLVSRDLVERHADGALRVGNLVHVAVPNAGTPLADPKHMGTFLDTYTSMLSLLPDNGVTDVLEIVISVLKQVAVGTLAGLDGLQSMNPGGTWIAALNGAPAPTPAAAPPPAPAPATTYRAMAAEYEPTDSALMHVADRVVDAAFESMRNDLVVPTDGVHSANGSPRFPIDGPLVLPGSEGVWHSGFFGRDDVVARLHEWLPGA